MRPFFHILTSFPTYANLLIPFRIIQPSLLLKLSSPKLNWPKQSHTENVKEQKSRLKARKSSYKNSIKLIKLRVAKLLWSVRKFSLKLRLCAFEVVSYRLLW